LTLTREGLQGLSEVIEAGIQAIAKVDPTSPLAKLRGPDEIQAMVITGVVLVQEINAARDRFDSFVRQNQEARARAAAKAETGRPDGWPRSGIGKGPKGGWSRLLPLFKPSLFRHNAGHGPVAQLVRAGDSSNGGPAAKAAG
jgi:hypothetical protein